MNVGQQTTEWLYSTQLQVDDDLFQRVYPARVEGHVTLGNLYYSSAARAWSVAERLVNRDWDVSSFSSLENSALGREGGV